MQAEIKKALVKKYGLQRQFYDFLNDIQNCIQEVDESTKDYAARFERQYRMAITSAETKYPNQAAKYAVRAFRQQKKVYGAGSGRDSFEDPYAP